MTRDEDRIIEAMARAMCEADGLYWDEAREAGDPDRGTATEAYAVSAEVALRAALAVPGEAECANWHCDDGVVFGGTGDNEFASPCPDCNGTGFVPSALPALVPSWQLERYDVIDESLYRFHPSDEQGADHE